MRISKNITNLEIADLLRAVAASYKLKGEDENRFKIIAYERAADAVEHESSELKDIWDDGKLESIAGIGKSISEHLGSIFETGRSYHFDELLKGLPRQMFELMSVSGIGAKTAYKLTKSLNIGEKEPLSDLEKAARDGKIEILEGFGKESQEDILKAISEVKNRQKRLLLPYANQVANELIEWIKKNEYVERADPLGSLRRNVSTIGDIDIAVATNKPKEVLEHFTNYPKKQRVIEKGVRTASMMIPGDIQVDVMLESPQAYGALLQHFTGSKHHNIALREYALKKGLSLSEYGIKNLGTRKHKNTKTEEEFYTALELDWIPPELREDKGEIQSARDHKLPNLIDISDVKADLQIHSDFDIETSHDLGLSTMEEIVQKANDFGYEYVALTEHNPSHTKHNASEITGLIKRKKEKVEQLNTSYVKSVKGSVIYVFNSLEIDILTDGKLPVPDSALELLDFALVSIHSSFRQTKKIMTKRVLSALSHPKVKIFAHPTGRKLGAREGIELDWEKIFEFCISKNKWLEINADPMRLDLPDFLVKEAIQDGLKLTLGTDAHHIDHMNNMIYGVSVARRGWAEKNDILNTKSFTEFEKMI